MFHFFVMSWLLYMLRSGNIFTRIGMSGVLLQSF